MPWFCAMSKPNHEQLAAANLKRQCYEYYLPLIKQAKPGKGWVIEPLFRRYLFIFSDGRWYSIKNTKGISHFLTGEDGPKTVNPEIIAAIKAREGPDGMVCLVPPPKFLPGQTVKVEEGPFAGHFALFEGMTPPDRCHVLMSWLGGKVKATVGEALLAAA